MTYAGSALEMFVDGVSVGSVSGGSGGITRNGIVQDLRIGRDTCCGDRFGHGLFDEVLIYDRALNQSEIVAVVNNTEVPEPSTLLLLGTGLLGLVGYGRRRKS